MPFHNDLWCLCDVDRSVRTVSENGRAPRHMRERFNGVLATDLSGILTWARQPLYLHQLRRRQWCGERNVMSERRRSPHGQTLQLQRELTASSATGASFEAIPDDWSIPAVGAAIIRVTVPFSGTVPTVELPKAIRALTRSRRADLAGVAWAYLALAPRGCAAVVVPESFLAEATQGHIELRRELTREGRVQGIVRLAAGVYKPRSGAAVLVLGAPDAGPVWFCEVVDPAEMPQQATGDVLSAIGRRWCDRQHADDVPPRSGPSFLVPRDEVAAAQFDWSPQRYRPAAAAAATALRAPQDILMELAGLEAEIFQGIRDLVGVMKR